MSGTDAVAGLALPIAAILLVLVAMVGPGKKSHARVSREGGTIFLSEKLMQRGYDWIDWLARGAVRVGISADFLSWTSLGLGLVAGLLAGAGVLGWSAWALGLSGLCDGLDGAVARLTDSASRKGAVLDSVLDRYVELFFCAGLIYYFRERVGWQLVVLGALFGGLMVTYSTAKAEALQLAPSRGWMKRPERLVWFIAAAALAAAAGLWRISSFPVVGGGLAVVALFANLSAVVRLRSLGRRA